MLHNVDATWRRIAETSGGKWRKRSQHGQDSCLNLNRESQVAYRASTEFIWFATFLNIWRSLSQSVSSHQNYKQTDWERGVACISVLILSHSKDHSLSFVGWSKDLIPQSRAKREKMQGWSMGLFLKRGMVLMESFWEFQMVWHQRSNLNALSTTETSPQQFSSKGGAHSGESCHVLVCNVNLYY